MNRVCILNALQTSLSGGIGRYSYELSKSLYEKEKSNIKIVIREEDKKDFLFAKDEDLIIVKNIKSGIHRNIYEQIILPFKARKINKKAILHYPDSMAPLLALNDVVITVHDLAFKTLKGAFTWKTALWKKIITPLSIIKAKKVVAITEFAKSEIYTHYRKIAKDKVVVVYNGFNNLNVEKNYRNEVIKNEKLKLNIDKPYILTVSTISPRKNIDGLIKAFNIIKDKTECNLIVGGKNGWLYESVYETVENLNLKERVIFTGSVTDYELSQMYKNCALFVYPSFYEGFGLPPLEAMSYNKKCAVSNSTSIPEVVGSAGIYFDPSKVEDIAEKLLLALNRDIDVNLIHSVLNKFSWEKCADGVIKKVYDII